MSLYNGSIAILIVGAWVAAAGATPVAPNPSDPNLQFWFKADSITGVSNGGPVNNWADSSSNGNNLTAIATAPKFVAGTPGTLNGQPYVQFNGSSGGTGMVSASAVATALTGDLSTTVFVVLAPPTSTAAAFGWGQPIGVGTAFSLFTGIPSHGTNSMSVEYAGLTFANYGANVVTPNAFQIIEIQKSPGAIDNSVNSQAFVNGAAQTLQGDSSGLTPSVTSSNLFLGQFTSYTVDSQLTGGIAELIVYDSVLSSSQSAGIEQYLSDKFFVPEPGSLVLMALGAICLAFCRRRRTTAKL